MSSIFSSLFSITNFHLNEGTRDLWKKLGILCGIGAGLCFYLWKRTKTSLENIQLNHQNVARWIEPQVRPDLPTFTQSEIQQHNSRDSDVWVTYFHAVYDITDFVDQHPSGAEQILMAAGKEIEPFWSIYETHLSENVVGILEKYRIGNLNQNVEIQTGDNHCAYKNEPRRHPVMKVNSEKPFCAEAPGIMMTNNFFTPNQLHFVRNHHPVPIVDLDLSCNTYQISILFEGKGTTKSLNFKQLINKFKPLEVASVMQCAGNRRTEFNRIRMTSLAQYEIGALSCAKWKGARLCEVLQWAGLPRHYDWLGLKHVTFEGLDRDPVTGVPFMVSIPLERVLDPRAECLLAYAMNDKPLPRDHGFPVRVVAPGLVGFRQCKWLCKITVSKVESQGVWQKMFYKVTPPRPDIEQFDFDKIPESYFYPVQSVITEPSCGATISKGTSSVSVKGVACSGFGIGIRRVDVTIDGGKTWHQARLKQLDQPLFQRWAWTQWQLEIEVPKDTKGCVEVRCKAVDDAYNNQPEQVEAIWNLRGCFNNSQHRIKLYIGDKA